MSNKGIVNLIREMYGFYPWQYCKVIDNEFSDYSRMVADCAIKKSMEKSS